MVDITDAKGSELAFARCLKMPKGSIVAADRGYVDFEWFNQLDQSEIYFVNRLKSNIK
jgi:putative transposase